MEESRNVEDLHQLRLMALLHELVRERDLRGAAEALGLDPRTLSASMERGQLSGLVQLALERRLLADGDAAVSRCREEVRELRERVDGLEGRVAAVEGEEGDSDSGPDDGVDLAELAGRVEEQGRVVQQLERRLSRAEAGRGGSAPPGGGGAAAPGGTAASVAPERRYPDLVTEDPAADDEQVFGAAWPLIEEWRGLWRDHDNRRCRRSLAWLNTEARIRELEVAMLERHGLTLPPETEPLRGLDRGAQLNWRRKALEDTRRALSRRNRLRRARRLFTLGLWWR